MTDATAIRTYWDAAADTFDDEPDHGLRQEPTRAAWASRLASWIPGAEQDVLDVGCGTGSLSRLVAEAGHRVTGVDLAPRMVDQARAKLAAAGLRGRFPVGDAEAPPTGGGTFDVVLSRHLVWTLPDPRAALRAWGARLRPGGTLLRGGGGRRARPMSPGGGAALARWRGRGGVGRRSPPPRRPAARRAPHERSHPLGRPGSRRTLRPDSPGLIRPCEARAASPPRSGGTRRGPRAPPGAPSTGG